MSSIASEGLEWCQSTTTMLKYRRMALLGHGELTAVHSACITQYADSTGMLHNISTESASSAQHPRICVKEFSWSAAPRKQRLDSLFELRLLAAINHPAIVRMYGAGFHMRRLNGSDASAATGGGAGTDATASSVSSSLESLSSSSSSLLRTQDCMSTSSTVAVALIEPSSLTAQQLQALAAEPRPFTPFGNPTLNTLLRKPPLEKGVAAGADVEGADAADAAASAGAHAGMQHEVVLCVFMEFCDGGDVDRLLWELQQMFSPQVALSPLSDVPLPPAPVLPDSLSSLSLLEGCSRGVPELTVWVYVAQLILALSYLHLRGKPVVHRDVKPANIYIKTDALLALGDFGIAMPQIVDKPTDGGATAKMAAAVATRGHVVGTPAFLAPELLRGGLASPASDVWGLGCVLFQLCTGRQLFHGDNIAALSQAILSFEGPPRVHRSPQLNALLCAMLAPVPEHRPCMYALATHPMVARALLCLQRTCAAAGRGEGAFASMAAGRRALYGSMAAGLVKEQARLEKWGRQRGAGADWAAYWGAHESLLRHADMPAVDGEAARRAAELRAADEAIELNMSLSLTLTSPRTQAQDTGAKQNGGAAVAEEKSSSSFDFATYEEMVRSSKSPAKKGFGTKTFVRSTEEEVSSLLGELQGLHDEEDDGTGSAHASADAKRAEAAPASLSADGSTDMDGLSGVLQDAEALARAFDMMNTLALGWREDPSTGSGVDVKGNGKGSDGGSVSDGAASESNILDDPDAFAYAFNMFKTVAFHGGQRAGAAHTGASASAAKPPSAPEPHATEHLPDVLLDADAFGKAFNAMQTMLPSSAGGADKPVLGGPSAPSILDDPAALRKAFDLMRTAGYPMAHHAHTPASSAGHAPPSGVLADPDALMAAFRMVQTATPAQMRAAAAAAQAMADRRGGSGPAKGSAAGAGAVVGTKTFLQRADAELNALFAEVEHASPAKPPARGGPPSALPDRRAPPRASPLKLGVDPRHVKNKAPPAASAASAHREDYESIRAQVVAQMGAGRARPHEARLGLPRDKKPASGRGGAGARGKAEEPAERVFLKAGAGKDRFYAHQGEGKKDKAKEDAARERQRQREEEKERALQARVAARRKLDKPALERPGSSVVRAKAPSAGAADARSFAPKSRNDDVVKPWKLKGRVSEDEQAKLEERQRVREEQEREREAAEREKKARELARVEQVRAKAAEARAGLRALMRKGRSQAQDGTNDSVDGSGGEIDILCLRPPPRPPSPKQPHTPHTPHRPSSSASATASLSPPAQNSAEGLRARSQRAESQALQQVLAYAPSPLKSLQDMLREQGHASPQRATDDRGGAGADASACSADFAAYADMVEDESGDATHSGTADDADERKYKPHSLAPAARGSPSPPYASPDAVAAARPRILHSSASVPVFATHTSLSSNAATTNRPDIPLPPPPLSVRSSELSPGTSGEQPIAAQPRLGGNRADIASRGLRGASGRGSLLAHISPTGVMLNTTIKPGNADKANLIIAKLAAREREREQERLAREEERRKRELENDASTGEASAPPSRQRRLHVSPSAPMLDAQRGRQQTPRQTPRGPDLPLPPPPLQPHQVRTVYLKKP